MALIKCSECGQMVSDKASSCPKCGNPIDGKSNGSWKKPIMGIVILLIIIAGAFGIWNVVKGNTQSDIQITKELSEAVHRYDEISDFHEGLLAVRKNQKWGYINSKGEEVIPCKYEYSCDFSEGLACVYLEGDDLPIAFIDKKGNTVIDGFFGDTQQGGFWIISFENGKCFVFDKERDGFWIDKEGKKTNEPQETDNADGVASDYVAFSDNGIYGMKDSLGNVVIEPKYSYIYNYSEGVALAYLYCGDKTIYGLVDKKGNDTFSKEDFELFSSYRERELQRAKQAEEERKRQEEEASTPKTITIYLKGHVGNYEMQDYEGNYGAKYFTNGTLRTNYIKVPDGKVWIFKNYTYKESGLFAPRICSKDEYNKDEYDRSKGRSLDNMDGERFFGGQIFIILCTPATGLKERTPYSLEVNFIEKNENIY